MSHKLTVMTELMRWTLDSFHGVAPHSVAVIPHGVPDRRPLARRTQGTMHQSIFPGKRVIMTNGLIHGFKGIEYMIAAMPAVSSRSKVTPRVCVESDGWRVEKRRGLNAAFCALNPLIPAPLAVGAGSPPKTVYLVDGKPHPGRAELL